MQIYPRITRFVKGGLFILALIFLFPQNVLSADFTVSPVRLFFPAGKKAETLTIKNHSTRKLTVQFSTFAWAQDETATDNVSPTSDIILFPKIAIIEGGEERVIRVGSKVPPVATEKTYRIYVEEVPEPMETPLEGAAVRTRMKIGVPLFISPRKEETGAKIEAIAIKSAKVSFVVRNTGNTHFIIKGAVAEGIGKQGESTFKKELSGWYVLNGKRKPFSLDMVKEECLKTRAIKIRIDTDKLSVPVEENVNVAEDMCAP